MSKMVEMPSEKIQKLNQNYEKQLIDLRSQLLQEKEDINKLTEEIDLSKKSLMDLYLKNREEIKKITVVARIKKQDIIAYQKSLKSQTKTDFCMFTDSNDIKASFLYQNFRDLQHSYFTLKNKVMDTVKVPTIPPQQKKKKKQKNSKKQQPQYEDITASLAAQTQRLNQAIKEKHETMNQMNGMLSHMQKLNEEFSSNMEQSKQLRKEIKQQQNQVQQLEEQLEKALDELKENELKLAQLVNLKDKKEEEINQLKQEIEEQRRKNASIRDEKNELNQKIKEKDDLIEEKLEELAQMKKSIEKLRKKNMEMKNKIEQQFENMQKIVEESFSKYKMLDDLIKKDKIQMQLLNFQNKKIISKDKLILNQTDSISQKDLLIEKLLKEKFQGAKGDTIKQLANLMPSQAKKQEKEIQSLSKKLRKANQKIKEYESMNGDIKNSISTSTQNDTKKNSLTGVPQIKTQTKIPNSKKIITSKIDTGLKKKKTQLDVSLNKQKNSQQSLNKELESIGTQTFQSRDFQHSIGKYLKQIINFYSKLKMSSLSSLDFIDSQVVKLQTKQYLLKQNFLTLKNNCIKLSGLKESQSFYQVLNNLTNISNIHSFSGDILKELKQNLLRYLEENQIVLQDSQMNYIISFINNEIKKYNSSLIFKNFSNHSSNQIQNSDQIIDSKAKSLNSEDNKVIEMSFPDQTHEQSEQVEERKNSQQEKQSLYFENSIQIKQNQSNENLFNDDIFNDQEFTLNDNKNKGDEESWLDNSQNQSKSKNQDSIFQVKIQDTFNLEQSYEEDQQAKKKVQEIEQQKKELELKKEEENKLGDDIDGDMFSFS